MIHRTGKRATHKTKDYSVSIQSTEADIKGAEEPELHHDQSKPEEKLAPPTKPAEVNVGEIMERRAKFIPLRLKMEERKYLRL
jgi:hypothetical protein